MQQELSQTYIDQLEAIASAIQNSPLREAFLETEEEPEYRAMCETFEPQLAQLYQQVAANAPLQLVTLEEILLNDYFEGLYLPRVLAYAMLRGQINKEYKYTRPQNHFKNILITICESANFEFIKKRIGQTVQVGFALSSDIWITDLINSFSNKRLRYYLSSNKVDRYRDKPERQAFYERYHRQFIKDNYMTADFPSSFSEMKVTFPELEAFLTYRIANRLSNGSLNDFVTDFCLNKVFWGTDEHIKMLAISLNFFDCSDYETQLSQVFNAQRQEMPEFTEKYLQYLNQMHYAGLLLNAQAERRATDIIDKTVSDQISEYYRLSQVVHGQGYDKQEVMDLVKDFYHSHEGSSTVNECVRNLVYAYLHQFIISLTPERYQRYFDISKIYRVYMRIFANQQFNQQLKDISMSFVRKCLLKFTDKRARDYQDVKKFVSSNFTDAKFLETGEVTEMFKTRRKRKPKTT
jgi:hypothetical protein